MTTLKIYKTHPAIVIPRFATAQSACFDIALQGAGKVSYKGFSKTNSPVERRYQGTMTIMPGERIMAPTGMIFDIPKGYSIRIHPRSGLSFKQGLILANLEAVIDSDYVEETFVLLTNFSENPIVLKDGDRIAQAEMVRQEEYAIEVTLQKPGIKTDRVGGMGSTGISGHSARIAVLDTGETVKFKIEEQTQQEPVKRGRGRPRKNPVAT